MHISNVKKCVMFWLYKISRFHNSNCKNNTFLELHAWAGCVYWILYQAHRHETC